MPSLMRLSHTIGDTMSSSTEASMIGVYTHDTGTSPDTVCVVMAGGNATELAHMDMTPDQARRFAMRVLQTCELAEGKAPVNA